MYLLHPERRSDGRGKKPCNSKKFDYLVIESTGISEPLPVAETFTFEDEDGFSLSNYATLDTMVTVVDAFNFLKDYESAEDLKDRDLELGEEDQRSIAHLLVDQIEFADVILLNKIDLVSKDQLSQLYGIIKSLNTNAKIIETLNSNVPLDKILNTKLFDFERASKAPGWLKVLRGEESTESDEYGVSSISFNARKPFHPEKFHNFLHTEFPGLYRAKGFFWIASQPDLMAEMAIAGTVREYNPKGYWWSCVSEDQRPDDRETIKSIKDNWDPHFGDREQKLVFIGKSDILEKISGSLENCLLTDAELAKDSSFLKGLKDPFGDWGKMIDDID